MDIFVDDTVATVAVAPAVAPPLNRVRAYLLTETGQWAPIGVGLVTVGEGAVRVVFEDENMLPFAVLMSPAEPWKLEAGSIIQVERVGAPDAAFSFSSPEAADPTWRALLAAFDIPLPMNNGGASVVASDPGGDMNGNGGGGSSMEVESSASALTSSLSPSATITLPEPTLENLAIVLASVRSFSARLNTDGYDRLAPLLLQGDFLRQFFLNIFPQAEARRDDIALRTLNQIGWEILHTQHSDVLNALLSDTLFESMIGVFEYDTQMPTSLTPSLHKRYRFRRYLRRYVAFRQAAPITDPVFLSSVHFLWRLNFLHDILGPLCRQVSPLSHWLLTSLSCAEVDIVARVSRNKALLRETYSIVRNRLSTTSSQSAAAAAAAATSLVQDDFGPYFSESEDSSGGEEETKYAANARAASASPRSAQHDAVAFLAEFIRWTRSSSLPLRHNMYQTLQEGEGLITPSILLVLNAVLCDPSATYAELSLTFEILSTFINFDPKPSRDYISALITHPAPPPPPRTLDTEPTLNVNNDIEALGMGLGNTPPRPTASGGSGVISERIRPHERSILNSTTSFEHGAYVTPPQAGNLFGGSILHGLVWRIVDDPDTRVQGLAIDLLRALLDVTSAPPSHDIGIFLEYAFSRYLPWLYTPFTHMPPTTELPRPVESMKNLDTLLQEIAPVSSDSPIPLQSAAELQSTLRQRAQAIRTLITTPLKAEERIVERLPADFCGSESISSKSSKQCIAELLIDLAARHPIQTKALVQKLELFASTPRLCLYSEKHLVLLGIKLLRTFAGMKDNTIAL